MTPVHIVLATAVMMVMGFNFVAAKVALAALPPIFAVALRFAAAGLLSAPFVPRPTKRQWLPILGVAFTLGCCHFTLMFSGLKGLDASTAAIASQVQVPFAALLAAVFFKERLGWWRAGGMAVAFAGIVLIAGEPRLGSNLGALFLVLAASLLWAATNIQIKGLRTPISGLTLNAWLSILAVPQLLIVSAILEQGQLAALASAGWRVYAAVLYMAVAVTIIGYGVWYHLLSRYPVNQMMAFTLLIPVFGVLSGVIFLDDHLTGPLVIGGSGTIAGVAALVLRRPRMVASPPAGGPQ